MEETHQKTSDEVKAQSPKGLEILKHAFSDGGRILEFSKKDGGEMTIADITDHVQQLEKMVKTSNANSNNETTKTT